jgi:hypothetical protein
MKYLGLIIQTTAGPPMVVETTHQHVGEFIHGMSYGEGPIATLELDGGKPRYYVRANVIFFEPLNEADWAELMAAKDKAEGRTKAGRILTPTVQAG